ncbi:Gfo/Idh/MocA family protein [Microbacterium sp. LWH12-1.2]|uniref:Gfo/Idh/MocA family protein n=1 Tax=Microbacterium sp. LWH12-1.2 TaxID=3135259 RepID=UPI003447F948
MTIPRKLRVAIIGTGTIAQAHAEAFADVGDRVELIAVADVDAGRAALFAADHGVGTAYSDATDLFTSERLDIVSVCTPPQTHTTLAIAAVEAGVIPLVEKPTALSLREMDKLEDARRSTGLPILTVFQHRFGPAALRLRDLARGGVLGRPLVASCETLWYRPDEYFAVPWRGRWDVEGGGPTMGHGIHQFDLLLAVLGEWADVSAMAARQLRPTDTEDVSVAVVRFADGALATVINSVVSPRETSRLRFDFEYATVEVEHLYGYRHEDWTFTPAPGHEHLLDLWNEGASDLLSGHTLQITAILDALDRGHTPEVDLPDARRTIEFAAAVYASSFRSSSISFGELIGDDPFTMSMDGGAVPWAPRKGVSV